MLRWILGQGAGLSFWHKVASYWQRHWQPPFDSSVLHGWQAAYEAEGRHYHGNRHLAYLWQWSEDCEAFLQEPALFRLAILGHDLVYEPLAKDNEARSAALFLDFWRAYLSPQQLAIVQGHILATAGHQLPQEPHPDTAFFLDLDLAILAAPEPIYAWYAEAVAKEYLPFFPIETYKLGRKRVLAHFLERENLFFQPSLRAHLEQNARLNVQKEIAALDG